MIQTFDDYEAACSIIDKCKCDPDCDECKRGIESTDDFEGMILTAALHGDMEGIINAGGARPHRLLTWSEPDATGDIRAGQYTIITDQGSHEVCFARLESNVADSITETEDLESAKLACERHVRKMLGWEA